MATIRLRFKDINDQVIGDLEVSREIPVQEMLPLILRQLNLEGDQQWKLVLEQNRSLDPRYSFAEVGARDGSLIRVMATNISTMPLLQEMQLTIAAPSSRADLTQSTSIHKRDLTVIIQLLRQQHHLLIVAGSGIDKTLAIRQIHDQASRPNTAILLNDFQSVKSSLRDIARILHKRGQLIYVSDVNDSETLHQRLARWQIDDLITLIYDSLQGHGYLLTIENLDRITPSGVAALQRISQVAAVLATVSPDHLDQASPLLNQFECIELTRSGYFNAIWIGGILTILLFAFFLLNWVTNVTTAYITVGGLFVLFLSLRAFSWQGPTLSIKRVSRSTKRGRH